MLKFTVHTFYLSLLKGWEPFFCIFVVAVFRKDQSFLIELSCQKQSTENRKNQNVEFETRFVSYILWVALISGMWAAKVHSRNFLRPEFGCIFDKNQTSTQNSA